MDYQKRDIRLFAGFAAVILILGGCAAWMERTVRVCPGKETASESLSSLRVQLENSAPLKADGQCLLQYYTSNGKPKRENFPVKLWVNPPVEIYMQGDIAFDPKGVVLGSNEDEFWLAVRPKEVRGYWWGRWSEKGRSEKLMIGPKLVLEALGIVAIEDIKDWSLSKEEAFDVLTKEEGGIETKKMYVDNYDYLVRKIEYFNDEGRATIVTELDKHKKISKDFSVPSVIKIINRTNGDKENSVQITFSSVKPANFTDKQRRRLFTRPQPQGFQHIYKIVDDKVIEQSE